ncbi:uncharacterized protein TNCV_4200001 [Trichonephila clavipes]|uniref:Mutator-like transposase domain-containing protein n=1 Tax=Trichonephila clavipes TaxID=2585209 RepID=A0A8X6WBD8_TRICX|nr:uncharacterized protein TNCV_4200001 [Trichonephila clavipes]
MEAVGAFRIFERSLMKRDLYDGDSKGFLQVKDIHGENSVTKLECIGHIQKRVGSRLRKLKKNTKGLGGKGKLTEINLSINCRTIMGLPSAAMLDASKKCNLL